MPRAQVVNRKLATAKPWLCVLCNKPTCIPAGSREQMCDCGPELLTAGQLLEFIDRKRA
jgi:hypothetical protein